MTAFLRMLPVALAFMVLLTGLLWTKAAGGGAAITARTDSNRADGTGFTLKVSYPGTQQLLFRINAVSRSER